MPAATIATKVGKTLDIHRDFATPITLDDKFILNDLTDAIDVFAVQVITVHSVRKIHLIENLPGRGEPYSMNIGQCSIQVFVLRKVNSSYSCQNLSPSRK